MDKRKVVIIGAGHVGSHVAMALCFQGTVDEIVFIDKDEAKAKSNCFDVADACLFLESTTKIKVGDYEDCKDAQIIINSIGMPRKPGQTRPQMLTDSIIMLKDVISHLKPIEYKGIIVSITNPADVIGNYLRDELGLDRFRCFSTGTSLDTARLKRTVSELSDIDRKSVCSCAIGEHGDTSFIPFSNLTIGGQNYKTLKEQKPEKYKNLTEEYILERTRVIGYDIINGKGSTEFGIGAAAADICKAIFHDEKRVIPASVYLEGEYEFSGMACGVPCIIGREGIEEIIELPLNEKEKEQMAHTCNVIKSYIEDAKKV
ncbi:malate dehydrogenase (NAD) [Acetitomaculum ruminis DSM 5522]|uniref:L-lactate dehydrogenase n=1 Tax=Acetitomaculum ruminis DSM 5522 TaxID=1120918 RepID=A0A1I0YLE0_9FIRM|nr:L-lactate dehydrogenase [Acetitomaculum ruminis]SFB14134.1 malate dehydrogenase (NAD) [Acetitomaculum ruminis DSM 5522]